MRYEKGNLRTQEGSGEGCEVLGGMLGVLGGLGGAWGVRGVLGGVDTDRREGVSQLRLIEHCQAQLTARNRKSPSAEQRRAKAALRSLCCAY